MVEIDFQELGIDVIAGTVLGTFGAGIEYTAAGLLNAVSPAIMPAASVPIFAGITGLALLAGAVFYKVGSKMWNKATAAAKAGQ